MKSIRKKFLSFILITILTVMTILPGAFMLPADAVSADSIDSYINQIFTDEKKKYNVSSAQQLLDGYYSKTAGVSSDWFVYALMQYNGSAYDFSSYISALEKYVNGDNSDSAATREKFALIFGYAGKDRSYINSVMNNDIGAPDIMSNTFGLHLFNNGFTSSSHTSDEIISTLLSSQNDDGGWALSGTSSDIDVTAMVVQSLAPHIKDDSVKLAVNKAVTLLSSRQLDNGGYKSYGKENPESAAQVIVALTSLKINPLTDSRFIKNGKSAVDFMLTFRASDYGYSHTLGGEYNLTATSQVLYSLISIRLMERGQSFYIYAKSSTATTATSPTVMKSAQTEAVNTTAKTTTATSTAKATSTRRSATRTEYSRRTAATKKSQTASNGVTVSLPAAGAEGSTTLSEKIPEDESVTEPVSDEYQPELITSEDETPASVQDNPDISQDTRKSAEKSSGTESGKSTSPKVYIISGIWALAVIAAAVLLIRKNKKIINYIIIAAVGGVLTVIVIISGIQSPEEFYNVSEPSSDNTITVTISITCDTVAGKGDESVTPSDGIILPETEITLDKGATVYDCLIKTAKLNEIQLEDNTQTLTDHTHAYIAGINNLYEFDYGDLSGWMYSVDGNFADVGCGEYTLSGGEIINWEYTCNLGDDLK